MYWRYCYYLFLIAAISVALYGCATIINGSTQDVQVIMPQGTQVTDAFGDEESPMIVHYHNGYTTLRLKRKKDYTLRFRYKGMEALTVLSSSLEPAWFIIDFLTFYGLIVDGITGAWDSFDDPITIRFPVDSSEKSNFIQPMAEVAPSPDNGIVLSGKLGLVFPTVGISYGLGLGYEATPKFTFLLLYEGGSGTNILPNYSSYYAPTSYTHFNVECRYKMQSNFYITGGGGLSNITSDSLQLDRYSFNDTTGRLFQNPIHTAPANKWMPTLFAGIGITGSTTFVELRHTFGLLNIPLANGEVGKFETTSLTFGVNLHF